MKNVRDHYFAVKRVNFLFKKDLGFLNTDGPTLGYLVTNRGTPALASRPLRGQTAIFELLSYFFIRRLPKIAVPPVLIHFNFNRSFHWANGPTMSRMPSLNHLYFTNDQPKAADSLTNDSLMIVNIHINCAGIIFYAQSRLFPTTQIEGSNCTMHIFHPCEQHWYSAAYIPFYPIFCMLNSWNIRYIPLNILWVQ